MEEKVLSSRSRTSAFTLRSEERFCPKRVHRAVQRALSA
jgi:hypothetical protein